MPNESTESTQTPTHLKVLILGRAGGGRDGEPGGVCFYDGGHEYRCAPGEVVDAPIRVAAGLIADDLAELAEED